MKISTRRRPTLLGLAIAGLIGVTASSTGTPGH
jgi:hypothetical protein